MRHGQKKKKKVQRIPELEESGGLHGWGGLCTDPLRNLDANGHVVLWAVGRRWGLQEKAQKQTGVPGTLRAVVLQAGVQTMLLARWQPMNTGLKSFYHLIN